VDRHIKTTLQLDSGQLYGHDSPTLRVLIFFPTAQKILKFFGSSTSGTFAVASTPQSSPKATSKEPLFSITQKHFPYFSD
jgi:hypothetical protein